MIDKRFQPPAASPAEPYAQRLARMSDEELLLEEDRVFLEDELNFTRKLTRWSAGRIFTLALAAAYWGLLLLALDALRKATHPPDLGILLIVPYLGSLFVGVVLSGATWRLLGPRIRSAMRTVMHYWPVTVWAVLSIVQLVAWLRP